MRENLQNIKEIPSINPIIEASNLSKTYHLGAIPVHALDKISFSVDKGEIVFIMGSSGSGKTTLLNLIGGIDSPTSGKIIVCEEEIATYSFGKLTSFRKRRLSFVFQFYSLIPSLNALENVELTLELMNIKGKKATKKAKEYLEMVELQERIYNFPSQLSGGERQRVAIARALAKNPDVLLIDEPTGQLDENTGKHVVEIIQRIAREHNKTVILVTHDTALQTFADRIITLRSGKIVSDNTVK